MEANIWKLISYLKNSGLGDMTEFKSKVKSKSFLFASRWQYASVMHPASML